MHRGLGRFILRRTIFAAALVLGPLIGALLGPSVRNVVIALTIVSSLYLLR